MEIVSRPVSQYGRGDFFAVSASVKKCPVCVCVFIGTIVLDLDASVLDGVPRT